MLDETGMQGGTTMRRITMAVALVAVVTLLPAAASAQTVFWLDTPADGATVTGIVEVSGWILDDRGVSNIDLYVDGVLTAAADINIARYDVLQAYPWYAGTPSENPGFSTSFETSSLTSGSHTIFLHVTFSDSSTEDFGQRSVVVDGTLNQAPFGELEYPGEGQAMNGVFPIMGWALDDGNVVQVEVTVDGLAYGDAVQGIHRPDVGNRFPTVTGSDYAGFLYNINTTKLSNGVHTIGVRLWDDEGASRLVGQRRVQVLNNWANLAPFGEIEYPQPDHVAYAIGCAPEGGPSTPPAYFEDPRTVELVTGWALDPDDGVKWVELDINGVPIARTNNNSCWYYNYLGLEVECYGAADQLREDIFRLYSDVMNSKHSQFTFAFDVSDLMLRQGFHQGLHYITVRAGDRLGHQAEIGTIPVVFDCDDDPDRPAWGYIDTPERMERVDLITPVTGWALDYDQIMQDGVEIWVDGTLMGIADFPLSSLDVTAMFPYLSSSWTSHARFEYNLDTTQLADGEHQLVVITEDYWGGRTAIAQIPFVVDNLNQTSISKASGLRTSKVSGAIH